MAGSGFRRACLLTASLLAMWAPLVAAEDGTAQMTGGNLNGGACSLDNYTLPDNIYGAALSGPNWDSGNMCGACLNVQGPKGSIMAMVVDECPGCKKNQVNLFTDGFKKIGDPSAGTINIKYDVIYCNIKSGILIRNKTGSSQYWFEMQIVNANQPVTGLDVSTDNGKTWQATQRQDYNYFKKAGGGGGFGTSTVTLRISCYDGNQVTISGVGVNGNTNYLTNINC